MDTDKKLGKYLKSIKDNWILILFFLMLGIGFLFLFSWSTSVLFNRINMDSDIFMLMGKYTKQGMVPYKDFFDHKGPVLVFIQWLGALIGEDKIGYFVVQSIFLLFTLCGIYKLGSLFFEKKTSVIIAVASLLVINMYIEGGNLTEEYCLPFLTWSMYYGSKYLLDCNINKIHNPRYSFLYGITFAVCALTRITNAVPLCCMVLVGLIVLLKNKILQNLVANIGSFLCGAIVVTVPFIVCYEMSGALYDMIYATFIYNFRYTSSGSGLPIVEIVKEMSVELVPIVVVGIVGIVGAICIKEMKYINIALVISGVIAIMLQLISNPYGHYLMVWVPAIVVAVCVLIKHMGNSKSARWMACLIAIFMVVSVSTKNVEVIKETNRNYNNITGDNFTNETKLIIEMMDGNTDSVIAYNVYPYFYLVADIKPCYKYFVLQDWQCAKDMEMYQAIKEEISSLKAEYIVMNLADNSENTIFGKLIEDNYYEVGTTYRLRLMKLRDK